MAIELIDKVKPKNNGSFAMVDACDVEMPDGTRLDVAIAAITPVVRTQSEYDALVSAGAVEPDTLYLVLDDDPAAEEGDAS